MEFYPQTGADGMDGRQFLPLETVRRPAERGKSVQRARAAPRAGRAYDFTDISRMFSSSAKSALPLARRSISRQACKTVV